MKTIIVDCNNLIHKIPVFRKKFTEQMDSVVFSLVEAVKSKVKNFRLIFVFDGFSDIKKHNVIFSGKSTADEVIRRYIEDNYNIESITVVSSDYGITNLAKMCGCEVKKSEDFWKELNPPSSSKNKNINQLLYKNGEKPDRITKKELDEFKKYFT
jgi:predicted RNA-binding protein with PIN domain